MRDFAISVTSSLVASALLIMGSALYARRRKVPSWVVKVFGLLLLGIVGFVIALLAAGAALWQAVAGGVMVSVLLLGFGLVAEVLALLGRLANMTSEGSKSLQDLAVSSELPGKVSLPNAKRWAFCVQCGILPGNPNNLTCNGLWATHRIMDRTGNFVCEYCGQKPGEKTRCGRMGRWHKFIPSP